MSGYDEFMSRDPVVRVEEREWCRIVDVDGMGLRRVLTFPRAVTWLRDSSAQAVVLTPKGRQLEESSTFCDVGRLLQSVVSAMEAARELSEEHCVAGGGLRVEVRVKIEDYPALPLPKADWDGASTPPRWRRPPQDWFATDDVEAFRAWLSDPERRYEESPGSVSVRRREILAAGVAWSSAWDAVERVDGLDRFLEAALQGLPAEEAARLSAALRTDLASA